MLSGGCAGHQDQPHQVPARTPFEAGHCPLYGNGKFSSTKSCSDLFTRYWIQRGQRERTGIMNLIPPEASLFPSRSAEWLTQEGKSNKLILRMQLMWAKVPQGPRLSLNIPCIISSCLLFIHFVKYTKGAYYYIYRPQFILFKRNCCIYFLQKVHS